ncbi:zinc finger protein 425 [Antennarius striatus]|uniref:zinc finger protein 425 n=1 Tax=Antennarius striatus TaxID=241820 RepID=UPI0035AF1392
MLGFQGSTSSSKVYRCVACSATFNGLASLLVHQATHADAPSKVHTPPQLNKSPHEAQLSSVDASNEHQTSPTRLPPSPSPSFYICDCGEEFQDFSLMLEHKRSHQLPTVDNNSACFTTQPGFDLHRPSTSRSPATLTDRKTDVSLEDDVAIVTPQGHSPCRQEDDVKEFEDMSTTAEQISDETGSMYFQDQTKSVLNRANGENVPSKNHLMKLLASAYMTRFNAPPSPNQSNNVVTTKQEVFSVDVTPGPRAGESRNNDLSVAQLRRLLITPSIKTKAPSISRVLDSSRKKIVSLTKPFSPVVVLETRQKLKDPNMNGTYGRYQCGRCRRVFQNLDKLTEHHFLHKKERIKCCRRCKQLIIGRMPLPDNHLCMPGGVLSRSFKNKSSMGQKLVPFHSLSSTRKIFFCPLCKHSYARRWNLKNHKCQGPSGAASQRANFSIPKMLSLRSLKAKTDAESVPQISKSVAVGTDADRIIKEELIPVNAEQSSPSKLAWMDPEENFSPKFSMMELQKDSSGGASIQQENQDNIWDTEDMDSHDSNEGQWTMPLDDEVEELSSTEKTGNGIDVIKSVSLKNEETVPHGLRYFISDGVKRYPCSRCQKTYSRPSTLRRHLRLCGFRPRGLGTGTLTGSQGANVLNATLFPCFVCGKTFNRKDNMVVHRNKCQLRQTMANMDRETVQQSESNSSTDCQRQENDGVNWGIMSLPSVLPRRVTCECGAGFTSPSLLLEHLQKHAQESYTCPTCGETVNSWADYEVHLQIHMHPRHQLLKGIQPQRSQPLLLRFEQQQLQQQPSPSVQQPPQQQIVKADQFPHNIRKKQRIVCTRCGNTFASRCSLKRHLSWDRCKGLRATNSQANPAKTYHCSHCNSDFPNTISLLFHQRSGACKPAIKPVRCPVCLRWFGTVDSLQKHLLSHKQTETYRCDVCQGTYPNLKSLKNHRRRIHRILVGNTQPNTQEQLSP